MKKLLSLAFGICLSLISIQAFSQCNYSLQMDDTWGDGWNGGTIDVYVNGTTTNYGMANGGTQTIQIAVNTGDSIHLDFLGGSAYNGEISFTLFDAGGSQLYTSGLGPVTGVHYGTTAACPSCVNPTGLSASNVTSSGADLAWTDPNGATDWTIEYGLSGYTQGTGTSVVVSSNPYSLTGLSSNSDYDFYVSADCGGSGVSGFAGPFTFATAFACPAGAVCNTYTSGDIASDYDLQSLPGFSNCLGSMNVVIPAGNRIDSVDTYYEVTAASGAYMSEQRSYLYCPSVSNGESSFASGAGTGGTFTYLRDNLTFANGATGTVAIEMHLGRTWGGSGCDASYNKVDDGSWRVVAYYSPIPPCVEPISLLATNVTGNSADLSWTDQNGSTSWELEYGPSGFTQGTGTTVTVSSTSYSLSGLSSQTPYDWYVSSDCGVNGTSAFAMGSFTTPCASITAPWTETVQTSSLPNCWSEGGDNSWEYDGTNAYGAAGVADHSGTSGSFFVMDGSDNSNGEVSTLNSPPIDISSLTNPMVSFFIFSNNTNSAALNKTIVELYDGSTWHTIDSIQENLGPNWVERTELLSGYTITGPVQLRFSVTGSFVASAFHNDILLDDIGIVEAPSCPKPSDLLASSITINSASISWTENAGATQWMIEYGAAGFSPGIGSAINTNPYSLSGLSSNTSYDVYIRSICGVGDSSDWVGPYAFETPCDVYTAPYSNDFESDALDSPPSCWTEYESYPNGFVEVEDFTGTAAPYAGSQALYLYSSSGFTSGIDTLAAISPQFTDLTAGDKRIVFQANSDDPTTELIIATTNLPNSAGTFNILDTVTFAAADTYEQIIFEITTANGYNGTDEYIVFMHDLVNTFDYIRIDDFQYEEIPACANPFALSASNVSTTTFDLSWTNGGTETAWNIEYGPTGFTQGTGTTVAVTTNPYTLTGLTANTTYDIYVQADCGKKVTSPWEGPLTESTLCNTLAAPYSENFDAATFPSCWTRNDLTEVDITSCSASGNALIVHGVAGVYAESPELDLSGINTSVLVKYEYRGACNNAPEAADNIDVDYWDGTNWINAKNYDGSSEPTVYTPDSFTVPKAAISGNFKVRFYMVAGSGSQFDDFTFDNFEVVQGPTCPAPIGLSASNLTPNSVDLSWTSSASNFFIEWGTAGFTLGTGTQISTTSNPYTLSTLNSNTAYDWYVMDICTPGSDSSDWSLAGTFTTPCSAFTAPYSNDFESDALDNPPSCWTEYETYTSGFVEVEDFTGTAAPYAGSQALYIYSSSGFTAGTDTLAAISPQFTDLTAGDKRIRFQANSDDPTTSLVIATTNMPGAAGTYNIIDTITFAAADTYENITLEITTANGYNGTDEYLAFIHDLNNTFDYIRIDDFTYETIPACNNPSVFTSTSVSQTTVDLSWTNGGTETAWHIEYGAPGFTQASGTGVNVNSNPYTLSGLSPNTSYDIYLRAHCGLSQSPWIGPVSITTLCTPFTATYSENFDGVSTAADFNNAGLACWQAVGPGAADIEVASSTDHSTTNPSAPNIIEFNDGNWPSDSSFLVSPPFSDLSSGLNRIRMQVAFESTSASAASIFVGVMSDPSNTSTFVALDTLDASDVGGTTAWGEVTINLDNTGLIGSATHIAMAHGPGFSEAYIDDFVYEPLPTCFAPSPLSATNLTSSSAGLSWSNPNGSNAYVVEYGAAGFTLGTGTQVSGTGTSTSLSGLMSATDYDWYVQSVCTPGSDSSAWVAGNEFATLCDAFSLPYTQDFENSGAIPNCWAQGSGNGGDDWEFVTSITYGPTSGFGGSGYFATIDDSSPHETSTSLETPQLDLSGTANPGLEFQMWSEDHGSTSQFLLHIDVDAGSGFTNVTTLDVNNADWELQRVSLDGYQGQTVIIRFRGEEVGTGFQKDIAIDNISVDDGFLCENPTGLRALFVDDVSARLEWDNASNTSFKVRWAEMSQRNNPAAWSSATKGAASRHDISGLSPNTAYIFNVRAWCKAGWSPERPFEVFHTLANPCDIPTNPYTDAITDSRVRFNWDAMPNTVKYRLRYREVGTSTWTQIAILNADNYRFVNTLSPSTTYEWRVKNVCEYGEVSGTKWSSVMTFTTNPAAAPGSRIKSGMQSETRADNLINIYPNPNKGEFNIKMNLDLDVQYTLEVRDLTGRIIQNEIITGTGQELIKPFEINEAQGVYLIRVASGNDVVVKRIIVE
ncbi:MAG: fibronectin type III domain-containing protein [Vicingaceae bacterium]